jgi:hypothetical protein
VGKPLPYRLGDEILYLITAGSAVIENRDVV